MLLPLALPLLVVGTLEASKVIIELCHPLGNERTLALVRLVARFLVGSTCVGGVGLMGWRYRNLLNKSNGLLRLGFIAYLFFVLCLGLFVWFA